MNEITVVLLILLAGAILFGFIVIHQNKKEKQQPVK